MAYKLKTVHSVRHFPDFLKCKLASSHLFYLYYFMNIEFHLGSGCSNAVIKIFILDSLRSEAAILPKLVPDERRSV